MSNADLLTGVQVPESIALDTSLLGLWAAGWARRERLARELVEALLHSNRRLMIVFEYLEALVAHGSDEVIAQRADFIGALRQVYWIRPSERSYVGSVLDIKAAEVRARLAERGVPYPLIIGRTRPEVLAFGETDFLVELLNWPEFRSAARERIPGARAVESVVHAEISVPQVARQLVEPARHRVPLATALRNFDKEERHLASQLKAVGDPRLVGSDNVTKDFFDELRLIVREAERDGTVLLADALHSIGIEGDDLTRLTSANILAQKYVWKKRSRIIARVAGVSVSAVEALRRSEMPSVHLSELIAECQSRSRRASGSDPTDASLACLSFYADITTVDKRTAECVCQIRRTRAVLDAVMGRVMTLSNLEALAAELHR